MPRTALCFVLSTVVLAPVAAQSAAYVRYTPVVDREIHASVRLPGTVESERSSVVASEAAGLIVALEVRAGDRVEQGQPLARLRRDFYEVQLDAARSGLEEAEARLRLAESQLRRARDLFDDNVVSQADLDDAISEHTAWQARRDQSRAEIARLELVLEYCTVRAPFAGAIVEKRSDVGQWVALGDPVVEMVSLDDLRVRVDVPERYFDLVASGVETGITFEALPGLAVRGSVERVIPSADTRARTFPVLVGLADTDGRVAVGMLADVALPVGEAVRALLVPKDAVVRDGSAEVVYRIDENDNVEIVPVRSGSAAGAWVAVEGDVAAGQRVVTRGNERLRPGQAVRAESQEYALP